MSEQKGLDKWPIEMNSLKVTTKKGRQKIEEGKISAIWGSHLGSSQLCSPLSSSLTRMHFCFSLHKIS